ncbi:MAG TPA: PfkB family carbohydrate kinase [Propionibacteriaceae bacterium]|nr:PfkB family carbohydrate kinase [Propionibacteriaceae bacterium]
MSDPALIVAGSLNLDLVAATARLPRPGETVADGRFSRQAGGKGANQAAAAARLGGRVRMVGCVGADAEAEFLLRELTEAGVDVTGVQRGDAPTGTALILVDAAGENSIVVCPGANALLDPEAVDLGDAALLVQLETPLPTVERLVQRATGLVVLNAAPARELPDALVERADLVVVNEDEYASMPQLRRARRVVVTFGARGAALYERGTLLVEVPGVPMTALNTVGAGDAFTAAFTLALLDGETERRALELACRVGAAAVADERSQPRLQPLDAYRSLIGG